MTFTCSFANYYYPTYNGSVIDAIECTDHGWSLPEDIQPITCQHIKCPPLPNVGDEVDLECRRRDFRCTEAITSDDSQLAADNMDNEIFQHCQCQRASYRCKKEGFNYRTIAYNLDEFVCIQYKNVYYNC